MPNMNPNCSGSNCRAADGEVRVYPIGGGANLILCHDCFAHENAFNRERGRSSNPDWFPAVAWATAEHFPEGGKSTDLMVALYLVPFPDFNYEKLARDCGVKRVTHKNDAMLVEGDQHTLRLLSGNLGFQPYLIMS